VTTTHSSAWTCDICGKMETTFDKEEDHFHDPMRWAEVQWTEPPAPGGDHRQYKRLDLCPDHLNSFLKWVTEEQAKRTAPSAS
jgi:hypothetical protein